MVNRTSYRVCGQHSDRSVLQDNEEENHMIHAFISYQCVVLLAYFGRSSRFFLIYQDARISIEIRREEE